MQVNDLFPFFAIEKWWWCLHNVNVQWAIPMSWPYRIIMYNQQNTLWYTQPTSNHHHSYSWCNVVLQRQVQDTMTRRFFGLLLHWSKLNKIWNSFGMQHQNTQGCHQESCASRGSPSWNSQITGGQTIVLSTVRPYTIFKNRIWNNRVAKWWRRVKYIY